MAFGGQEADLGALVLEERVGRDRRAVHDPLGPGEQRGPVDAERLRQASEALHQADRLVGRRRGHLGYRDPALRIDGHEVRERAANVDADPKHASGPLGRDKSERHIPGTLLRRALPRLAPAATASRMGVEHVARSKLDAGLLRPDCAIRPACRLQPVAMRLAVLAAQQAAGAVLDAIACRIADGGLRRLDDELELAPRPAAVAPVPAAVGAELVAAKVQGKPHLLHLDAAELDAARRLPLAGSGPTVARRRAAAARTRLEQMPDKGPLGARIDALYGHPEASAPARHRPLGTGRREGADYGLDDLLAAVI